MLLEKEDISHLRFVKNAFHREDIFMQYYLKK